MARQSEIVASGKGNEPAIAVTDMGPIDWLKRLGFDDRRDAQRITPTCGIQPRHRLGAECRRRRGGVWGRVESPGWVAE